MDNIARKAHVPDPILLEFAGIQLDYLPNDLAEFTAFDPDLNPDKMNLLRTTYESALTFGTDRSELGVLRGLTEKLSAEFRNCISIFKDVRYFAMKKFSDRPSVLNELGINTYQKARQTQATMVVFMFGLAKAAEKYKADLMSAGLKETVISSIKPAAEALEKCNVTQETGKKSRSVKAEDRIILMNKLYNLLLEFSNASKIVFANDPLTRSKYVLPYNGRSNGQAEAAKK